MNNKILTLALCSHALVGCGNCSNNVESVPSQESVKVSSIVGDWSGVLDAGITKLTLVLHIHQNPDGSLNATIDTLEQNVNGTLIDLVAFDEGALRFEIKAVLAKFEGLLMMNESEISGQLTQAGQSFPLSFKRGIKALEASNRPQEPKLPLPYTEEHVSYDNLEAGVTLSGTLTLPASEGPFPVVLLIAGSGPNDRDETVFSHKPFLVLADHLTRQGIAVLRFDKRGCGKSTGNYGKATTQDFSDDVLAGIEFIKSRKEVNLNQICLIGHSEGGIIAPKVAAKSKDVAFVVLMAGTGVNGEEILYEQSALIQRAAGETEDKINQSRRLQEQMFTLVKKEPDPQIAAKLIEQIAKNYIDTMQETQKKVTLEYLKSLAARVNTEWFRYFLTFDPNTTLKQVRVPALVLNGELDLQVSSKQNLPAISKALEEAGNKDFTIIELPQLNHLFQTCETGSIAEYAKIEETISPSVLNLITKWILERTVQNKESIKKSLEKVIEDHESILLKESKIGQFDDGIGTFANRDFKKGEVVIKWDLKALSDEEYENLPKYEKDHFCHQRNGIRWLYPDPERHVNRFHSPNVVSDFEKEANIALRDIMKGEELSIDINTVEDF